MGNKSLTGNPDWWTQHTPIWTSAILEGNVTNVKPNNIHLNKQDWQNVVRSKPRKKSIILLLRLLGKNIMCCIGSTTKITNFMTTTTIVDATITTWSFIDYTAFLFLLLLCQVESFVRHLSEFEKENQLQFTCDCYLSVTIVIFAEK